MQFHVCEMSLSNSQAEHENLPDENSPSKQPKFRSTPGREKKMLYPEIDISSHMEENSV